MDSLPIRPLPIRQYQNNQQEACRTRETYRACCRTSPLTSQAHPFDYSACIHGSGFNFSSSRFNDNESIIDSPCSVEKSRTCFLEWNARRKWRENVLLEDELLGPSCKITNQAIASLRYITLFAWRDTRARKKYPRRQAVREEDEKHCLPGYAGARTVTECGSRIGGHDDQRI